jgi:hypothetical protein
MTTTTFNQADYERGDKVVQYALRLLQWGTGIAVAWGCSSFLMGVIMFLVTMLFMALISAVIDMLLMAKGVGQVEALGRFVGSTTGRVSAMFTRKEPAHA